ncbi:heme NO-binding domain-containing protein [Candidatus Margulisiibacteriota bacterium]
MKGIIFNLLEAFMKEILGEEKSLEIMEKLPLKTKEPFVGPGTYPDEDLLAIVKKVMEATRLPLDAALRKFGKFCIPVLAAKFPQFLKPHDNPKDFLKSVDNIHHMEVVKLYKDSTPPHFTLKDPAPDRLIMEYRSKRKLCKFMEGLIEGVAEYYKTPVKC